MGLNYDFSSAQICRERRKTLFCGIPLEFSLSHSGQMWMCASDTVRAGWMQQIRACSFEVVAGRQSNFGRRAALYGALGNRRFLIFGLERRLCQVHRTGSVFPLRLLVAGKDGDLCRTVRWKGKQYFFTDIDIGPECEVFGVQ